MIIVQTKKPTVRETKADYQQVADDGSITIEKIRVQYYSFTTKRAKEIRADTQAKLDAGTTLWHSEMLLDQLHGLPDLVDRKQKPCFIPHEGDEKKRETALDFLDSLEIVNVEAIKKAIDEDVIPKEQPNK